MMKRLAAGIGAWAILAGPVLAQTCSPQLLSAAVDRYAAEPFSARTWRVLQGFGDPMIDPAGVGDDIWSAQDKWRKLASELAPDASGLQNVGWNCRIGYPLSVLEKRIGSLGRAHPYVKQWLLSQEKVMQACADESGGEVGLPPPLEVEPAFANLQKMDRAYQEASIAFYRNKEQALTLFRAIARSTSPHRAAAAYNIANLLANAKRPAEARKQAETILADQSLQSVHAIARELLGYIANQEDTAESWTSLIDRNVAILQTPAARITASEDAKREYARALYDIDYAGVRAKDDYWWLDGKLPEDATISKALVDSSRKHPVVLWMMAGQSLNEKYWKAPWSLIGDKWNARTAAYMSKARALQPAFAGIKGPAADMLEALAAKPDDATRTELWNKARAAMSAAEMSCGSDPKTAAAGFLLTHAVRLSALAGKYEEAYAALDAVPFKAARSYYREALYRLAQYQLGQGHVIDTRKLRDRFISAATFAALPENMRVQDGDELASLLGLIAEDEAKWKEALKRLSEPASNVVLNLLPTTSLWSLVADTSFSESDRALLARAAWTRDYALRRKFADEHADTVLQLNPPMKVIADRTKADYPKAQGDNLRLLTILRSPRHNILVSIPDEWQVQPIKPENFDGIDSWDHNDKNWWCPLEPDRQLGALRHQADGVMGTAGLDDYGLKSLADVYDPELRSKVDASRDKFLKQNPMVKAINRKEVQALAAMPSAPRKLTESAIRWGKASKGDDGAPEALALAVKATRYGCNWHGSHERYSKAAQKLLQTRFRDTSWARETPYWFGCMNQQWDKDGNRVATCEKKSWPKQAPLR
jgi:hypothetical protein